MKMAAAIDRFITDMRAAGRINSDRAELHAATAREAA